MLTSSEIDRRLGRPDGWTLRASGVATRPVISEESQEGMGASAARAALDEAGLTLADVDLLLFAAAVGRQPIPATAPLIKRELGAQALSFPAYDVNATCLSALAALDLAALHIACARARHVLVVASEVASRALPWGTDPATASLFGDGAAAMVLSAGDDGCAKPRFGGFLMETYAEGYEACQLPAGGTRLNFHDDADAFARNAVFQMDGRKLYKLSADVLPGFLDRLLEGVGWSRRDVDLLVPHQASPQALAHIARRGGFDRDKVFDCVAELGNLVAASLPAALHLARARGRIQPGMKVLLVGTSAGVSLGGAALQA